MIEAIRETWRLTEFAATIVNRCKDDSTDLDWCGGVNSLNSRILDEIDGDKCLKETFLMADTDIVYLVIRDYISTENSELLSLESIAKYTGTVIIGNTVKKPSPSIKIKSFKCGNIASVSKATNIPNQTLRDWFITKKIAFHALMLYSKRVK